MMRHLCALLVVTYFHFLLRTRSKAKLAAVSRFVLQSAVWSESNAAVVLSCGFIDLIWLVSLLGYVLIDLYCLLWGCDAFLLQELWESSSAACRVLTRSSALKSQCSWSGDAVRCHISILAVSFYFILFYFILEVHWNHSAEERTSFWCQRSLCPLKALNS